MSFDLATERERHQERQAAKRAAMRPGMLLRACNPGATAEELRLKAEEQFRNLSADDREEIVQAALDLQIIERGTSVDPATVELRSGGYDPDRRVRRAPASHSRQIEKPSKDADLSVSEVDLEDSDQISEPAAAPAAAKAETTVPKPATKKVTPREDFARAIVWMVLQLIQYPKTSKAQLYSQLATAVGVKLSPSPAHYKVGNPAVLLLQRAGKDASAVDLLRMQYEDWGVPIDEASLAELAARIPTAPRANPAQAPAESHDPERAPEPANEPTVRCHDCGEPLEVGAQCESFACRRDRVVANREPVAAGVEVRCGSCDQVLTDGERCDSETCPESRRIHGQNLVITGGPVAAAPLEAIAHEPSANGRSLVESALAAAEPTTPVPTRAEIQGGGVLRNHRGMMKHQVRNDGTYVVHLELTTTDSVLFAEIVGSGLTGLLGAEVVRG